MWVDRSEPQIRYLEVAVAEAGPHVPADHHGQDPWRARQVEVSSILAAQFADAPALSNPDQVTKLEEDKITAYFASGNLYATPARLGATAVSDFDAEPVPVCRRICRRARRCSGRGRRGRGLRPRAFHAKVAIYCGVIVLWSGRSALRDGGSAAGCGTGDAQAGTAGRGAVAILTVMASRSWTHESTRSPAAGWSSGSGVALPVTINLPFARISIGRRAKHRRRHRRYSAGADRRQIAIAYLLLWPNARPWRMSEPSPCCAAIRMPCRVADILARALAAAAGSAGARRRCSTDAGRRHAADPDRGGGLRSRDVQCPIRR